MSLRGIILKLAVGVLALSPVLAVAACKTAGTNEGTDGGTQEAVTKPGADGTTTKPGAEGTTTKPGADGTITKPESTA